MIINKNYNKIITNLTFNTISNTILNNIIIIKSKNRFIICISITINS